jgi:hypothetical protein
MSSKILKLPESAQLLLDFARYCEIKRDCPHQSLGEIGNPFATMRDQRERSAGSKIARG